MDSSSTLNKNFHRTVYSHPKTGISKKCFIFFYCETKISKENYFLLLVQPSHPSPLNKKLKNFFIVTKKIEISKKFRNL